MGAYGRTALDENDEISSLNSSVSRNKACWGREGHAQESSGNNGEIKTHVDRSWNIS